MTAFIVQLVVAWLLLNVLFTCALAIGAAAFGIEHREISIGTGKELWNWGKVKLRAIPLGGYVRLNDTRYETDGEPADPTTAYNHKPPYVRALIMLTGCAVMAVVATLSLASAGISELIAGLRQIVVGAFGPQSTAQLYIQATNEWWGREGFVALLGLMAAKIAAFNLLPLPFFSGGQALLALLPADQPDPPDWQMALMNVAIVVWFALLGSWAYAVIYFAIGAGAP